LCRDRRVCHVTTRHKVTSLSQSHGRQPWLAHGHGDVHYAHYSLDIFAHDAKYTVGSFAKLLRDLERPPKSSLRRLFDGSRSSPLFEAILSGA
jgi:hypothetical protein